MEKIEFKIEYSGKQVSFFRENETVAEIALNRKSIESLYFKEKGKIIQIQTSNRENYYFNYDGCCQILLCTKILSVNGIVPESNSHLFSLLLEIIDY